MNITACDKGVVGGTEWPSPVWYSPSNVLIDACDDVDSQHTASGVVWWAAPEAATGNRAYFEVDLGCQKCVSQVTLRNSGNGNPADR